MKPPTSLTKPKLQVSVFETPPSDTCVEGHQDLSLPIFAGSHWRPLSEILRTAVKNDERNSNKLKHVPVYASLVEFALENEKNGEVESQENVGILEYTI